MSRSTPLSTHRDADARSRASGPTPPAAAARAADPARPVLPSHGSSGSAAARRSRFGSTCATRSSALSRRTIARREPFATVTRRYAVPATRAPSRPPARPTAALRSSPRTRTVVASLAGAGGVLAGRRTDRSAVASAAHSSQPRATTAPVLHHRCPSLRIPSTPPARRCGNAGQDCEPFGRDCPESWHPRRGSTSSGRHLVSRTGKHMSDAGRLTRGDRGEGEHGVDGELEVELVTE